MQMAVHYYGQKNLPELALMGLRFQTPAPVDTVEWLGLSGETYPDRKRGGTFGWQSEHPDIPDYLVPQECSNHADTQSVTLLSA